MSDVIKNAIHAVLADDEIKRAILEYLKSITTEKKEEWREVYHCQSVTVKKHHSEEASRVIGIPQTRNYRLFMRVYYNDSGNVGKVVIFEEDARLLDEAPHLDFYFYNDYRRESDVVLIPSKDASKVIDHAIGLWPARSAAYAAEDSE